MGFHSNADLREFPNNCSTRPFATLNQQAQLDAAREVSRADTIAETLRAKRQLAVDQAQAQVEQSQLLRTYFELLSSNNQNQKKFALIAISCAVPELGNKINEFVAEQDKSLQEFAQKQIELAKIRANTINRIDVTFATTRDDKDDQNVVTIEVVKDNSVIARGDFFAGSKLDDDTSSQVAIAISPPVLFDAKMGLRVSKSGTDGWIFHIASVDGVFEDRTVKNLHGSSGEFHFEDNVQTTGLVKLTR